MKTGKQSADFHPYSLRAIGHRRGFSLLELLAVMAIMVMLTTLAVTSYFAAVRGMARRSALKNLVNTLVLAHQRACMESARFSVVMFNEVTGEATTDVTPSYIVAKGLGQITAVSGSDLVDEFTPLEQLFSTTDLGTSYKGAIRLYNLTRGGWSSVYPWVSGYKMSSRRSPISSTSGTSVSYELLAMKFTTNPQVSNNNQPSGGWRVGDVYGVEASPIRSLPRNFLFTAFTDETDGSLTVTFLPNGSVTSGQTIQLTEKVGGRSDQQKKATITVQSNGTISYNEKWN